MNVSISIPYKRQCFNPQIAAYLQAVERLMNERVEQVTPQMERAHCDMMTYGVGSYVAKVPHG